MGFKQIPRIPVGADLSRTPPIYRPLLVVPLSWLKSYKALSAPAGCSAILINKVKSIICIKKNTAQTRHSCTLFDVLSIFV